MKHISIFLLVAAVLGSCNIVQRWVEGNGKPGTKVYKVKEFSKVDVGGSMKVYLTVGPTHEVRVETDENLLNYIEVRVDGGGTLEIETPRPVFLDPTGETKVYITAPLLERVQISGAAEVQARGRLEQPEKIVFALLGASSGSVSVRAPEVELYSKGASKLTVEGMCKTVKAHASGAATINAFDLKAESSDVEASGASTVRVFSSIALNAQASGASTIRYKGNPNTTTHVGGAASVNKE